MQGKSFRRFEVATDVKQIRQVYPVLGRTAEIPADGSQSDGLKLPIPMRHETTPDFCIMDSGVLYIANIPGREQD
jgi:hypothetical protein